MALGGCYTCLKYLMFVFNFIFWLVGCALLAVGIWAKVDDSSLASILNSDHLSKTISASAYVIIIVGSIILILGFLGCCGAIRESQCMLATFFVFLFIIFSVLVTLGVYLYFRLSPDPKKLEQEILDKLKKDVENYNRSAEARDSLHLLHNEFNCCGAEKGDFERTWGKEAAMKACGPEYKDEPGCAKLAYKNIEEFAKKYLIVIVAVSLSVATIMLLGMIFSMMLCCAIRETMA